MSKSYEICASLDSVLFSTSSPKVRKTIVELGCSVYNNMSCVARYKTNNDVEKMKDRHETEVQTLMDEVACLKEDLTAQSREYRKKRFDELQSVNELHNRQLLELKVENEKLQSQLATTCTQSMDNLERKMDDVRAKHDAELKTVRESMRRDSNLLMQKQAKEMQTTYDNHNRQMDKLRQENDALHRQLTVATTESRSEIDTKVDGIRSKYEAEIESLRSVIKSENEAHKNQLMTASRDHLARHASEMGKYEAEIMSLRSMIKAEHDSHKHELVTSSREESARHSLEIAKLESTYHDTIRYMKTTISALEESKAHKDEELKRYEKQNSMNNVEKGIEGETNVMEYLGATFVEGEILNTSKKGGHGDIHFKYKDTTIVIEVKNKDTITLEDVAKFKRDVLETQCQGGVFVSIRHGVKIPCHSVYDVEWVKGIPLIYITNFEVCNVMLYTCVKTIHFYHSSLTESARSSERERAEFTSLVDTIKCISVNIDDMLTYTKNMMDKILKMQTMVRERVDQSILEKYVKSDEQLVTDLIMAYEKTNNKLPNIQYLTGHNITKQTIKDLGGMKNIYLRYNSMKR